VRFVIVGAGAVGGVIGGRLVQHGHKVALVARGQHLAAIRKGGLRLLSRDEEQTLSPPATDDPATLNLDSDDVVILTVKGQDTERALRSLVSCAPSDIPVVCAQNGVVNERRVLRRVARTYGVCVVCPAGFLEPGTVIAYSSPITGILDIGCYPDGTDALAHELASAWQQARFVSEARDDVMRWKYRKLIVNLTNVVEALCGPQARFGRLAELATSEGEACLKAAGIDAASAQEDRQRRGDLLDPIPVGGLKWKPGSAWQSLARHTGAIEADELNGEIVLLGRLHGIPTPVNALLQYTAHRVARERAEPGTLSEDDLLARLASRERE
jgi:2-dehydropantoate 2-reductase